MWISKKRGEKWENNSNLSKCCKQIQTIQGPYQELAKWLRRRRDELTWLVASGAFLSTHAPGNSSKIQPLLVVSILQLNHQHTSVMKSRSSKFELKWTRSLRRYLLKWVRSHERARASNRTRCIVSSRCRCKWISLLIQDHLRGRKEEVGTYKKTVLVYQIVSAWCWGWSKTPGRPTKKWCKISTMNTISE